MSNQLKLAGRFLAAGWPTHSKRNSKSHIKTGAPPFRVLCGGWAATPPGVTRGLKGAPSKLRLGGDFPGLNATPY